MMKILFLVLIVAFGGLVYLIILDAEEWEKFKVAHNCKVVSKERPSTHTGVGVTPNGKPGVVIVTEPGKTGWLCDDGVTYYR